MDHAIGDCVSISQFSIRMTTSPKIFVAMEGPGSCLFDRTDVCKLLRCCASLAAGEGRDIFF